MAVEIEYTKDFILMKDDDMLYTVRRRVWDASQSPLNYHEQLIIRLCDEIVKLRSEKE